MKQQYPARQNGDFGRNFCLFSAHFPPMVPHLPFFHPHVYGYYRLFLPIFCLISAYFRLFFAYFLPIFHLKWCPTLIINSSMLSICRFSTHMFTDSAYFPLIFRPFSARPVLPGIAVSMQVVFTRPALVVLFTQM